MTMKDLLRIGDQDTKAYLVSFDSSKIPSLIFAKNIFEIAERNKSATKIEKLDCWIVPGQCNEVIDLIQARCNGEISAFLEDLNNPDRMGSTKTAYRIRDYAESLRGRR